MRVYNITQENSLKSLWFDIIFLFFITLIPLVSCIIDFNFITFPIFFLVVIIDILYGINIWKKRQDYKNNISYHKLIDYIDFNSDNIVIYAKAEDGTEKNIQYNYTDIVILNIELETFDSSTTRKHYTGIRDIAINIHTNDNSDYIIHSYHLTFGGSLRTIYDIIGYAKGAQRYMYTLKGTGDTSEIQEKLDYYISKNKKLRVEQSGRKDLKILSIIIFLWGCAISIVAILPWAGAKGSIISSITFAIIAYLIYFPVILDKKDEQEE